MENPKLIVTSSTELKKIVEDTLIQSLEFYFKYNPQLLKEQKPGSAEKDNNLLTIEEACSMLRCSRSTLHRYRKEGMFSYIKRGKNVLIDREDLQAFLKKITLKK